MDRKTFLERYGEEPDAWHPHLDEMLDKIESPAEYINAISKLLKLKIIESYKIEL